MANPAPGFRRRPGHRVAIAPVAGTATARFGGEVVARTTSALRLEETGYPPAIYFPEPDLVAAFVRPSAKRSHCPFKGDAVYLSLAVGDRVAEDAAWSYPDPFDECAPIRGHVAFYADRLDGLEIGD